MINAVYSVPSNHAEDIANELDVLDPIRQNTLITCLEGSNADIATTGSR